MSDCGAASLLPPALVYGQSSVRLPSSEGGRALLLQTSAHSERGQAGGRLVSTSTHTDTHSSCLREGLQSALVNQCAPFRWRGDYGGRKQLWFPANYVEELPSAAAPLGELDEAVSSGPEHISRSGQPSALTRVFPLSSVHREQSSGHLSQGLPGRSVLSRG